MKITKTSLRLLEKYGKVRGKKYDYRIYLIAQVLLRAEVICGDLVDGLEIYNSDNSAICLVTEDEKPILRGMHSRYGYIECTFTHGLNQVKITDPNKLIKSVVSEI